MAKRSKADTGGVKTADYRHTRQKRTNIPPAKIEAEGKVPQIARVRYHYSPHLPPLLQFDTTGKADKLTDLLAVAEKRALTEAEHKLLFDALHAQQPWLEWAGKREQHERGFLTVDPVALHIHERVSTQALLRVLAREDIQRELFADPEQPYAQAVQFYRHDVDWTNRLILGDSLQVMTSLARRENMAGKVQMIYMDPPYGIRFKSNFQPDLRNKDPKDRDQDLTREPEMVRAYRDTWTLGIHSYLTYLRDRLVSARELLSDTGSIFVQISNENLHRVRCVMDEVFGAHNLVAVISFAKSSATTSDLLPASHDYLIWFARDISKVKYRQLYDEKQIGGAGAGEYSRIYLPDGTTRMLTDEELNGALTVPEGGQVYRVSSLTSQGFRQTTTVPFEFCGRSFTLAPRAIGRPV